MFLSEPNHCEFRRLYSRSDPDNGITIDEKLLEASYQESHINVRNNKVDVRYDLAILVFQYFQ